MTKKKIAFHIVIVILLCIPVALIFYACFAANDSPSYESQIVTDSDVMTKFTKKDEKQDV